MVAATGIERGETGYPGAATSGIVKDSPGFIQAMLTKMKTGIAGGRRRAEIAVALVISKQKLKGGSIMKRREFLKTAGAGLAASTAVAAPAIAQSMPELKWRCTTSWPKSLDVPFSASETI